MHKAKKLLKNLKGSNWVQIRLEMRAWNTALLLHEQHRHQTWAFGGRICCSSTMKSSQWLCGSVADPMLRTEPKTLRMDEKWALNCWCAAGVTDSLSQLGSSWLNQTGLPVPVSWLNLKQSGLGRWRRRGSEENERRGLDLALALTNPEEISR